jgi:hypothetical protein
VALSRLPPVVAAASTEPPFPRSARARALVLPKPPRTWSVTSTAEPPLLLMRLPALAAPTVSVSRTRAKRPSAEALVALLLICSAAAPTAAAPKVWLLPSAEAAMLAPPVLLGSATTRAEAETGPK